MSSRNDEESGYGLNLDLLTPSYESHVSYHLRRSGLVGKSNHLRPIHLKLYLVQVKIVNGVNGESEWGLLPLVVCMCHPPPYHCR